MSTAASSSIKKLLGIEGDYSNHPSDPGGKTRYGITEKVARKHGYEGEMSELPFSVAEEIYKKDYWNPLYLDQIARQNKHLAYELFEFAVNTGSSRAVEALQRALNAFNKGEEYYDDLSVDGIMGPKTLGAWREFLYKRGQAGVHILLKAINSLQGAYYIDLAEHDEKFEDFVYGWINHRVEYNYEW